jgi:iron-sulfur cluster assembly protein
MSTSEQAPITLTESAAAKVRELMEAEPESVAGVLRVAVQGGSCAGYQYALGFDREALEDDVAFTAHGVQVVVDPYSAPFLEGAVVDFVSHEGAEGFTIENVSAPASCGCGSSFRAEGEEGAAEQGCGGCGC